MEISLIAKTHHSQLCRWRSGKLVSKTIWTNKYSHIRGNCSVSLSTDQLQTKPRTRDLTMVNGLFLVNVVSCWVLFSIGDWGLAGSNSDLWWMFSFMNALTLWAVSHRHFFSSRLLCWTCLDEEKLAVQSCSLCQLAIYCSESCQIRDWVTGQHPEECFVFQVTTF